MAGGNPYDAAAGSEPSPGGHPQYATIDPITGQPAAGPPVGAVAPYPTPAVDPAAYPGSTDVLGTQAGNGGGQPQPPYALPVHPQPGYPPPGYSQPGYPQPGYPQPGYPQPGYPQPVYPQPGYAPPGFPPGYGRFVDPVYPGYGVPLIPARPVRPAGATGAGVLDYIQGAFNLLGAWLILSISSASDTFYIGRGGVVVALGIGALLSGGLLIAGGVMIMKGRPAWQNVGAALSLMISVGFFVEIYGSGFATEFNSVFVVYPLIYAVLPIISLALGNAGAVRAWARTGPGV